MKESLKVGVSGVRGVVGESFTPQLAAAFAQAFGTFVGRGPVVVGRDTRPSGPMLEHAVIAGLQSVGCTPVLLGIVPTPTLLLATKESSARGGIAITASHNAAEWNALKFVDRKGLFLDEIRAGELFDIYHQGDFPLVPESELPGATLMTDAFQRHAARIAGYVDAAAIRARHCKVVVDCVNGVGALFTPAWLRDDFGCEVVALHDQPTGVFERGPEPVAENLEKLCAAVRQHGAAVGFAHDPDGDRLAIVDERGQPIGEDFTLALAAWQVLERHARGPLVMTVATSLCVAAVARAHGAEVIRTKIGEINVVEAMLKAGAPIGGEGTGGVIVPAIHPCRCSYAAMALVLELLAQSGRTVAQLRAELPEFHVVKTKLPIRGDEAPEKLRGLRRYFEERGARVTLLDGVHADFGDRWINVRRSNTEPVLRLTAEAATPAAAEGLLRTALSEIQP
ncbi:MAG: phosphoglucosamine mutase [Verrucomicrobia bacterium]|nr:MAG: phosphoglucosamine mutase [Verrucomicrobiota bacterium]